MSNAVVPTFTDDFDGYDQDVGSANSFSTLGENNGPWYEVGNVSWMNVGAPHYGVIRVGDPGTFSVLGAKDHISPTKLPDCAFTVQLVQWDAPKGTITGRFSFRINGMTVAGIEITPDNTTAPGAALVRSYQTMQDVPIQLPAILALVHDATQHRLFTLVSEDGLSWVRLAPAAGVSDNFGPDVQLGIVHPGTSVASEWDAFNLVQVPMPLP